MLTIIAAVGENNTLGKDKDLPWHLPDDFKRFKKITTGHPIIMGRKTFETFPKPLPNRKHIIITRQKDYQQEDCLVVHDLDQALELATSTKTQETFIIGGGEIYKQAMPYVDKIELTRIHHKFDGDTFFPAFDPTEWELTDEIYHPKDEKHDYSFTFLTYERKEKPLSKKKF